MLLHQLDLRRRTRAAGWHLLICVAVAALAAALVFFLWYPNDYRLLSGGRDLFFLVVSVDIVLGPLLTLVVFDLRKGWPHLRRDLAVIGAVQLAGLAYGLHTVYIVRPVATVFEGDRFRVVAANDVRVSELPSALREFRSLPLNGPWLLAARKARQGDERNEAIFMALEGLDTSQRPSFWLPYAESKADARAKARPVSALLARYPSHQAQIKDKLRDLSLDESQARFLPVMARGDWVALLNPAGDLVGFLPLDGYF